MLTLLISMFIGFVILVFIIAFPIGLIKVAKAKKYNCPYCENEIRFATDHGKCPKCKTKIYKHGDGTLRVKV